MVVGICLGVKLLPSQQKSQVDSEEGDDSRLEQLKAVLARLPHVGGPDVMVVCLSASSRGGILFKDSTACLNPRMLLEKVGYTKPDALTLVRLSRLSGLYQYDRKTAVCESLLVGMCGLKLDRANSEQPEIKCHC